MELMRIDTTGMRCPQPVLMLASKATSIPRGTVVEVCADCPTFERDVRTWSERQNRTVLAVMGSGPKLVIHLKM